MSQASIKIQATNPLNDAILPAKTSPDMMNMLKFTSLNNHGLCTLEKTLTESY